MESVWADLDADRASESAIKQGPSAGEPQSAASGAPSIRFGFQTQLVKPRDREGARGMLKQLHARTVFRAQVFADGKVDRMFDRVLARQPGMVGIVAEHDGAPVGIAWATADEYLLSDGPRFVTVHLVAVDLNLRPFRRAKAFLTLVTAIRQWAAAQGASPVFSCDDGGEPCRDGATHAGCGGAVRGGKLRDLFRPPIRELQVMDFQMMTRRISSVLSIIGLVVASPAIIEITSHFLNKSNPILLIHQLPCIYKHTIIFCFLLVIQYIYGIMMHIIFSNFDDIPIMKKKFNEIFENPFSRFFVWRETLDIYRERRGR
tara:strand:- start:4382 stop:5332 length:951 start_codon:yes stop_codon:yes gene_type:complete